MRTLALTLLVTAALSGCTSAQPSTAGGSDSEAASRQQSVVYGVDDREDFYAHPDDALRELTSDAIVAMVSSRSVEVGTNGEVRLRGQTLGAAYSLCDGERFAEQPTAASCSGTLIDDDLVLTAGHCVEGGCSGERWVFNYFYEGEGDLATITAADVFDCAEVVVSSVPGWGGDVPDYAIVRLDRAATPRHTPAEMNLAEFPVADGDGVSMVGFGSGLPAKLDSGGRVLDDQRSARNAFTATVDAFGGNSGSGVFDEALRVVGILVAGESDYTRAGGCYRVNTLEDSVGGGGETVTYAFLAVEALCESGWPSARLCGDSSVCGDGICYFDESSDTCPDDCEDEPITGEVPAEWLCDPGYYAVGDDCDCGCGAYDPDCDDSRLRVVNCRRGEVCDARGECVDPTPTVPEIPAGWGCVADVYGVGDGCDCECGAYDPDCDDPTQELYNCGPRQTCINPGICVWRDGGQPDTGGEPDAGDGPDLGGRADAGSGPETGVPSDAGLGGDAVSDLGATPDAVVIGGPGDGVSGTSCAVRPARGQRAPWLLFGSVEVWAVLSRRRRFSPRS